MLMFVKEFEQNPIAIHCMWLYWILTIAFMPPRMQPTLETLKYKFFTGYSSMCVWINLIRVGHKKTSQKRWNLMLLSLSSCFTVFSPLVRSHGFIDFNVALYAFCDFQDSTLCPLIHQPTTTLSSSAAPVGRWWQSVLLWKTLLRIARRGREPTCLQVLTAASQVLHHCYSMASNPHRFARQIDMQVALTVNIQKALIRQLDFHSSFPATKIKKLRWEMLHNPVILVALWEKVA